MITTFLLVVSISFLGNYHVMMLKKFDNLNACQESMVNGQEYVKKSMDGKGVSTTYVHAHCIPHTEMRPDIIPVEKHVEKPKLKGVPV